MSTRRKILITGAAGRIGTYLRKAWADTYDLVALDRKQIRKWNGGTVITGDIRDLGTVLSACNGIDTVVHLAADASPKADFNTSVLPLNIVGTHNVYNAAARSGVRRVIFASSIHAVGAYPPDVQVKWDMPVRPCCEYGAGKCYGEAIGSYFSDKKGLSVIAIRIGAVHGHPEEVVHQDCRMVDIGISEEDLTQLIGRCVEAPDQLRFAIFNGLSDNRFKRLDISHAREVLGYAPKDDAGERLRNYNIPEPEPVHPG
ncbi:MAG: NAD-dependent epimerase/dehydratase family protein [Armatimonadota bacterium]